MLNEINVKLTLGTFGCVFGPKNQCKFAKSHCRNEGSIINLGIMIVAFDCGNGAKFNIQV